MKRSLFGTVAIAAVALSVVLIGTASAAKPPAPSNNTCPTNPQEPPDARISSARRISSGASDLLVRVVHERDSDMPGVHGSINYCVYTNQTAECTYGASALAGADGSLWTASKPAQELRVLAPRRREDEHRAQRADGHDGHRDFRRVTLLSDCADDRPPHQRSRPSAPLGIASATCFVLPGPSRGRSVTPPPLAIRTRRTTTSPRTRSTAARRVKPSRPSRRVSSATR